MAFSRYSRLGYALGCIVAATLATTAPTYADNVDQTHATTDHHYTQVFVIGYVDHANSFDFAPAILNSEQYPVRAHSAFKPIANKARVSSAAVQATSSSGWRSGRLRRLSAG